VAAFPVPGPLDVVGGTTVGVLSEDLRHAALAALELSPTECRGHAMHYSWQASARQFVDNLSPFEIAVWRRGGELSQPAAE